VSGLRALLGDAMHMRRAPDRARISVLLGVAPMPQVLEADMRVMREGKRSLLRILRLTTQIFSILGFFAIGEAKEEAK